MSDNCNRKLQRDLSVIESSSHCFSNLLSGSSTLARMDVWPKRFLTVFPQTLILTSTLALTLTLAQILTLTLTLKHKNLFGKTKWRHFLGKCSVYPSVVTRAGLFSCSFCWQCFFKYTKFLFVGSQQEIF